MQRPTINQLLPVQIQAVLNFLNEAQAVDDLTNIEKHRPDLSEEERSSYSIGAQSAQNILDTRANLPAGRFNKLDEVLAVKGIGEDKVLDIVAFIWQPAEEIFRKQLFENVLGENWAVNYWRYSLEPEEYKRLTEEEGLLKTFIGKKVLEIANERHDNYVIGALAQALLEKSPLDRVEGLTAQIQFASWWFRFDEDNWFSFERISEMIDPFINYFGLQKYSYIDLVFFRGFMNGGTVADGISPDDLVVSLNPAEYAITIWGISLFD